VSWSLNVSDWVLLGSLVALLVLGWLLLRPGDGEA
jgi:hypothetical protein